MMADPSETIGLIAGLGNPGREYEHTPHNAGFWFLEALTARFGASFKTSRQLNGEIATIESGQGHSVRLFRPASHVNVSGLPIAAACRYYKLPLSSLLVAQDDIDLPEGAVRLRFAGGAGGHNGIRDIHKHAGKEFWRIKFGVGHPGQAAAVIKHVLRALPAKEKERVDEAIARAVAHSENLFKGDFQTVMNDLHGTNPTP